MGLRKTSRSRLQAPKPARPTEGESTMYRFVILFLVMASVAGGLGYFQENRWEASAVERSDRQARLLAREVAQEVGRPVEVNARVIEALAKLVEIQGDLSSNVLQLMVSAQRAPFVPFHP